MQTAAAVSDVYGIGIEIETDVNGSMVNKVGEMGMIYMYIYG